MKKTAFTLIELLIVLVIIGILTTLAIPTYDKFREMAEGAEAVANIGAIRRAVCAYYNENGKYPIADIPGKLEGTTQLEALGDARRVSFNSMGLCLTMDDTTPNRKWDYAFDINCPWHDHGIDTDAAVTAFLHSYPQDTRDPAVRRRMWHGHLKNGQIVGSIINKDVWPTGVDNSGINTHTWEDHQ